MCDGWMGWDEMGYLNSSITRSPYGDNNVHNVHNFSNANNVDNVDNVHNFGNVNNIDKVENVKKTAAKKLVPSADLGKNWS